MADGFEKVTEMRKIWKKAESLEAVTPANIQPVAPRMLSRPDSAGPAKCRLAQTTKGAVWKCGICGRGTILPATTACRVCGALVMKWRGR